MTVAIQLNTVSVSKFNHFYEQISIASNRTVMTHSVHIDKKSKTAYSSHTLCSLRNGSNPDSIDAKTLPTSSLCLIMTVIMGTRLPVRNLKCRLFCLSQGFV